MSTPDYATSKRAFPALLQHWRRQLGYTRDQTAAALGVPRATLDGWFLGRPCGQERTVRKLMQALIDLRGSDAGESTSS